MTSGETILEARDAYYAYVVGRPAVCGASLELKRGSMGAIIGPNGCGKSTLVRLLASVLTPERGEVRFDGVALSSIDRRALSKKMAYVPQVTGRTFPFTALEVVLTGRSPYVSRFQFEGDRDVEKAWAALDVVKVAHLAQRRITELSAGERQLVSLARALAQEPTCLVLDEPSASLDLKHRAGLMRTLGDLRKQSGLTVLMVTHDLTLLDPGFDIIFAMRWGAIAAVGTPAEVLRDAVLGEIYDDPHVRTRRLDGRTLVWSEV